MKTQKMFKEFFMITLGSFIASAAVFFFLLPSHLAVGSVSALALVISNFIPLKISVITFILNAALLIIGFLLIGRDFGIKTVYTSLLLPIFLAIFEVLFPNNTSIMGEPFVDMVCYIFVLSIGQAILFFWNASSGGLDIVGKLLNKFFHIELGQAIAMSGILVALSSFLVYDLKSVCLSLLGTYLSGIVLDHFIFGFNMKKRVCIISEKEKEIQDFIINQLHSGATIYDARGAYNNDARSEITTIVNKTEYSRLMNFLAKTDKDAFVAIYSVSEVLYKPKVF